MQHIKLNRNNIPTPYYKYNEVLILEQVKKLVSSNVIVQNIHFSLMANNNIYLLKIIKNNGLGVFISSLQELLIAQKAGFSNKQIIFCSSNLNASEIEQVINANPIIIADSFNQLEKYIQGGRLKQIGIRISFEPEFYKQYGTLEIQRQGLSEHKLLEAIEVCDKSHVRIIGIHSYLGTNISNIELYKDGLTKLFNCAILFKDIEFIDLSGGFGLDYSIKDSDFNIVDIVKYFEKERLKHTQLSNSIELKIEPGRFIMGPAGKLICSVTEVFEKDGKTFIGVDTNLSNFPRPYIYGEYHLITVYERKNENKTLLQNVYIVGNSAKSDDFFALDIEFPLVEEGDRLCIHYAGAYCYSMSSNFCAQLRPAEYLLTIKNEIVKIRKKETLETLLETQDMNE